MARQKRARKTEKKSGRNDDSRGKAQREEKVEKSDVGELQKDLKTEKRKSNE